MHAPIKGIVFYLLIATAILAQGRQVNIPSEPGMYVQTANGLTKIIGQAVTFQRSGSRLVSGVTAGIKSRKVNVQLLGARAQTVVGGEPTFYFIPAKQEADIGVNAGDLILLRLEEKKDRRQFEVAAEGAWRASSGISITHQIQLFRSEEKTGAYKLSPGLTLQEGEYALYIIRGEGMSPYVYDFSVNRSVQVKSEISSASVAPESSRPPGAIVLESDPTGAEVYADNSFVGKTPTILNLSPGPHYIRLFMKDYKNWSQQLTVVSRSELKLAAKLEKSD
jgi:PEGA domain-containing protein